MLGDHVSIWRIIVIAFAATAAISDLRWRKIPRAITTAGLLAGLLYHLVFPTDGGFFMALLATVLGFAIGLVFFHLGAIGGGDVKLIAALGAMLGFRSWLLAMEVAVLAAGAIALLQAARSGRLPQLLRNIGQLLRWLTTQGLARHPELNVSSAATLRAPFGVAVVLGTIFAVIRT